MIVHISRLLWNSTRSSRRDAGGRTRDGVGETGMEEVRKGRKKRDRADEGREGRRTRGRRKEERVHRSNEADK